MELADGRIVYALKERWRDGTTAVVMTKAPRSDGGKEEPWPRGVRGGGAVCPEGANVAGARPEGDDSTRWTTGCGGGRVAV